MLKELIEKILKSKYFLIKHSMQLLPLMRMRRRLMTMMTIPARKKYDILFLGKRKRKNRSGK
jgi:hypothetical protein